MAKKLSKSEVNYRESMGSKWCGNCSMWHRIKGESGECDIVEGSIHRFDLCDRWQEK